MQAMKGISSCLLTKVICPHCLLFIKFIPQLHSNLPPLLETGTKRCLFLAQCCFVGETLSSMATRRKPGAGYFPKPTSTKASVVQNIFHDARRLRSCFLANSSIAKPRQTSSPLIFKSSQLQVDGASVST